MCRAPGWGGDSSQMQVSSSQAAVPIESGKHSREGRQSSTQSAPALSTKLAIMCCLDK